MAGMPFQDEVRLLLPEPRHVNGGAFLLALLKIFN
jgi:hypothetical protein